MFIFPFSSSFPRDNSPMGGFAGSIGYREPPDRRQDGFIQSWPHKGFISDRGLVLVLDKQD